MEKYLIKIVEIETIAEGTKTYYFNCPKDLSWEEGAHTHIAHIGFDQGDKPDKSIVRHMSISTLPEEGRIAITTRVPGSHSRFKEMLEQLEVGSEMVLFKVGNRMALRRDERPIVLLSMGVGMATMRPIIKAYVKDARGVAQLININVDRTGHPIFQSELVPFENESYKNYWVQSRKEFYETLASTISLDKPYFYVAGSDDFILGVVRYLQPLGIDIEDVILDKKEEKRHLLLEAL